MKRIYLMGLIAFYPLIVQAMFYTWVDADGIKHVSTHPRECIDEGTKTLKIECNLNEKYTLKGDPEYTRQYIEEKRFQIENPGLVKGECGYPGSVFVNGRKDTEALSDLNKMKSEGGELILPYIIEIEADIKRAQEKAKLTCRNVSITAEINQEKLEDEMKELERKQQLESINEELNYLRDYFHHPTSKKNKYYQ